MLTSLLSGLAQSDLYDSSYDSYYYSSSSASDGAAAAGFLALFGGVFMLFYALIIGIMLVSTWKIFTKAGKPGWAALVPIYNTIVLLEIVNKPTWWVVLMFIPVANVVVTILVAIELVRVFGKSDAYAALLILVPIIGYPMLAFSKDAVYRGPQRPAAGTAPTA